jgi:RNA polymerase sigma-70 factor (ECF subfamily)
LIVRLQDAQDHDAWRQFVDLYAGLIYGFVRKRGVQDADAADLMQDVLRSVANAAGRLDYDPQRGSFRAWLYTITRNKLYTFLAKQKRSFRASGDSDEHDLLNTAPAADENALWDQEYERRVFAWAAEQIRSEFQPHTWQAFWRTAVDGVDPKEVAQEFKMSVGAVYVAKSRVLARLKEQVQTLTAE